MQEHLLLLTMHHIISDWWSSEVFFRELTHSLRGICRGKTIATGPLPIQYADYALWQRQWLQGAVLEQQWPTGENS